jgi:hypothetical protein
MKLVSENINFERGMDPMTAMDIGMFHFDVEFSGDLEGWEESEKTKAKKWHYGDVKILSIEGSTDETNAELYINLSDGDYIRFISYYSFEPFHSDKYHGKKDCALISIKSRKLVDSDVFEKYEEELENGSIILAVMRIYENIKNESIKESINFQRGQDPKKAMEIGIPTWETLQEGDIIYVPKGVGIKNDRISESHAHGYFPGGTILKVRELDNASTKEWVLRYIYFSSMEDYNGKNEQDRFGYLAGTPKQFREKFKLLPRSMNEVQNFERGIDPKEAMEIGDKVLTRKIIEETIWELPQDLIHQNFNILGLIKKFRGEPILIMKTKSDGDGDGKKYIAMAPDYRSDYYKTPKEAVEEVKAYLDKHPIKESLNFERGIEPKSSMGIGKKALIETWLKEQDLYEDAIIDKDLIINIPSEINLVVSLRNKDIEELPPYIQFGKVCGGFDISDNNLKTLRGCPTQVLETPDLKGNFKCFGNQLSSLEFAPKRIDGNFLCQGNPGHFTRKDVIKVCKVKSGIIWSDDNMIKESMDFQRNEDPMEAMDLGFHAQIINWFKSYGIYQDEINEHYIEYRINKDGTIDVLEDINLVGAHINNFPYFIHFNKIYGGFYVAHNIFTNLRGFPKEVDGDFSIYSAQPGAKKWKESEIRKRVKVKGTIWN